MTHARVVVCTPPMTQLNTPYPAGPHLVGYLRAHGVAASNYDAANALFHRLYTPAGLAHLFDAIEATGVVAHGYVEMVANRARYQAVVAPVVAFLQGQAPGLAGRMVRQGFLPQGPRFAGIDPDAEAAAFGRLGQTDHARWLATLFIQDLADLWRATISPHFGLTSYGAQVALSAASYDGLARHLATPPDPIEQLMVADLDAAIGADTTLLALTCPFPGNLPAALRIAAWCRSERPTTTIALGGGYPSTELRDLSDPRIFELVDAIVLDDGELPLERLAQRSLGQAAALIRTLTAEDGVVVHHDDAAASAPAHGALPPPSYHGIHLERYVDLLDSWNPMHRLWNEGRWLKLIAAHGCYWQRCTFCDTSLPYIGDYQPARATTLADRMDALHAETGRFGFHFTDEAAPPALLVALAGELLRRGRAYHWWGNIRFDAYFTPDRCRLLAAAGMQAVSGGIEVADDAVLARIDKGVALDQLSAVTRAFAANGILVHGYLMYGFPGQTTQQTIDSLEAVRQLIGAGCVHSG
ncbi:MAG: B12-binding domain-containing radical SAM protein, partial [Planctomycetota bacterium]